MATVNPFTFQTEYYDRETDKLYWKNRYYDPSAGRWLSKDPIGEQGGLNLYAFVENSPVDFFDCLGLYHAQQHRELTTAALNAVSANLGTSSACLDRIRKRLIKANLSQDSVWGNLWQNYRHYNRDVGQGGVQGDTAYQNYLNTEHNLFNSSLQNPSKATCKLALGALGRMSHTWQDFFMHAIRRDGKGGRENSSFPGWTAWSVGMTGTPEDRHNFFPSSYSLSGGGEHPPTQEPVLPSSAEWQPRFNGAQSFTTTKFGTMLPQWINACRCYCEDSWFF